MKRLVVIIVHTPSPTPFELASFEQCFRVLGKHAICIVCPRSLNLAPYVSLYAPYASDVRIEQFDDTHFTSVDSYNRLLLSPRFYARFLDVKHILLYQLDAWVFKDELEKWCSAGYDYIGAPWFTDRGEILPFAGNGGFCLRNAQACHDLLTRHHTGPWKYSFFLAAIPARTKIRGYAKQALHCLEMAACKASTPTYFAHYRGLEDMAFVKAMSAIAAYSVAPPQIAMHFSFERFPEVLFQRTKGELPFGAHALARYAPQFWASWVPVLREGPSYA